MADLSPLVYLPLVLMLCAVTVIDIRTRRIPNLISLSGIAVGFASWAWLAGWPGIVHASLGMGVGFILFLPFYLARGMGAGDVKLMAAVGTFLGPGHAFYASLVVAIVGGFIAALAAWRQGRLSEALRGSFAVLSRSAPVKTLEDSSRSESIPYGLAIAVGVVCYLFFVTYR